MDMFSRTLRAKFEADEALNCTEGLLFLSDVRDLFELLRAMAKYRAVAEFEEDRTAAILKLLAYLDRTKRSDMFIKYAHSLADMHYKLSVRPQRHAPRHRTLASLDPHRKRSHAFLCPPPRPPHALPGI